MTWPGGFAALIAGPAARAYGAAPPASRLLRIALRATALRAGPDPGDLCGPEGRKPRAGPGLPRPARGRPRDQPPGGIGTRSGREAIR
jgi:hypothetical protein